MKVMRSEEISRVFWKACVWLNCENHWMAQKEAVVVERFRRHFLMVLVEKQRNGETMQMYYGFTFV